MKSMEMLSKSHSINKRVVRPMGKVRELGLEETEG